MADHLVAPWTDEQVEALNRFQRESWFHPFTCGGERDDEAHRAYALEHEDRDQGLLQATNEGWICPVCDYRQNWAHRFMIDPAALTLPVMPGDDMPK